MDSKSQLIREDIDETRTALNEKLEVLEDQLRGSMQNAKARVEDTIENVKSSVRQISPSYQTVKHPFLMVGATAALGLLVGRRFKGRKNPEWNATYYRPSFVSEAPQTSLYDDYHPMNHQLERTPLERPAHRESLFHRLQATFPQETKLVRGLLISKALTSLSAYAKKAAPHLEEEIEEVVESAMHTLGAHKPKSNL